MRKLVCLLALLALAVPAMADPCDITITGYDNGNGQLKLTYNVDPGGDAAVGISLTLSLSNGAVVEADPCVLYVDPCFPVYIDYAHDQVPAGWDPSDPCAPDPCTFYNIGDGNPLADPCGAGQPTLPASDFSLCLGRLDPCAAPQGVERDLVIIQLADPCGAGSTDVTFAADQLRGGVVGSTFNVIIANSPTTVNFAAQECMKSTAPEYALWKSIGSPDCWCYRRQAHGDADNQKAFGLFPVYTADLALLQGAFAQTSISGDQYCADFDHAKAFGLFHVYSADLAEIQTYFASTSVPCGDDDGDCNLAEGDSRFNFWQPDGGQN